MLPIILSGGSGTRLWPLSRTTHPKQFLRLTGELTMLQQTLKRLAGLPEISPPVLICNEQHRFLAAEQMREIRQSPTAIILEPCARNTAPAIAVAAMEAMVVDPDAILMVLPADHVIPDGNAFYEALLTAREAAREGKLVTFGVVPTSPETGYGYIKRGEPLPLADGRSVYHVASFVEKPKLETAKEYLAEGSYYWNSGMFMFRADRLLAELDRTAPHIVKSCRDSFQRAKRDLDFTRLDRDTFSACPSDSIDYALMEKTDAAVVVPVEVGWSDVGSWATLHEVSETDAKGNVLLGDVIAEDTTNSYVRSEERLVATLGLDNHIVVETADAVLVANKERVQDVKRIVERLKAMGRDETDFHRCVYRPWGSYEGIARSDRFQVKHIMVKPGAALSLQKHHHRAEHWVVVKGTARVTCGQEVRLITEDQSTYIPLGTVHRLENPGVIPLEIIEVQTGSYLGEDDIVRYDDQYGRDSIGEKKN